MQNVYIIAVGRLKEKYLRDAFAEYQKRLTPFCRLTVIEIDEERLPDNPSEAVIAAGIEKEGQKILKKIPTGSFVHRGTANDLRILFPYDRTKRGVGLFRCGFRYRRVFRSF